jgi:hypothetical protein
MTTTKTQRARRFIKRRRSNELHSPSLEFKTVTKTEPYEVFTKRTQLAEIADFRISDFGKGGKNSATVFCETKPFGKFDSRRLEANSSQAIRSQKLTAVLPNEPIMPSGFLDHPKPSPLLSPIGRERERDIGSCEPRASLALCPEVSSVVLSGLHRVWISMLCGFLPNEAMRSARQIKVSGSRFNVPEITKRSHRRWKTLRCDVFRARTRERSAVGAQRVSTSHAAPLVRGADGAAHRPPPGRKLRNEPI